MGTEEAGTVFLPVISEAKQNQALGLDVMYVYACFNLHRKLQD